MKYLKRFENQKYEIDEYVKIDGLSAFYQIKDYRKNNYTRDGANFTDGYLINLVDSNYDNWVPETDLRKLRPKELEKFELERDTNKYNL